MSPTLSVPLVALFLSFAAQTKDTKSPGHAPCETPPEGMVCIPGGPAVVGDDKGPKNARPRRTVEISTFYLDAHEVTIEDYAACVKAGACPPLLNQEQRIMQPFVEPKKPAVPVDWFGAHAYCAFAGKRLPTEWEWEKAARGEAGDIYPWGNEPPSCDKAIFRECAPKGCKPYPGKRHPWDCVEHATKDVGSFPPGRYGVYDLAGNGYEWTQSWAKGAEACGKKCRGKDPKGPCDGAHPCPGHKEKVLRGGSWYWPKSHLRGFFRRFENPRSGGHRLSFRCASSSPTLTRFPPRLLKEERPVPPWPEPPPQDALALAHAVREDDVLKKEPCKERGRAFVDCRDPAHYIRSNEPRQYLFAPYIRNLGGGYVGIGIDQNYSFIVLARSEWAWLFDYDPTVTRLHYVLRAFILRSESIDAFITRFFDEETQASLKILDEEYAKERERHAYKEVFRAYRRALRKHYQKERAKELPNDFGWLRSEEHYRYIRTLYQQGRIVLRKGDMLARRTMQDIAKAAKALGVPVRVYYPSNAPELWPLSRQYKKNVLALPFDEKSVVLQTTSGLKTRARGKKGYWHYNVQSGLHQQQLLELSGYMSIRQVLFDHVLTDDPDLSVLGLPSE